MNTDDNPATAGDPTSEISTAPPQAWTEHDGLRHYLRQDYPDLEEAVT